jgi:hypothetical protein
VRLSFGLDLNNNVPFLKFHFPGRTIEENALDRCVVEHDADLEIKRHETEKKQILILTLFNLWWVFVTQDSIQRNTAPCWTCFKNQKCTLRAALCKVPVRVWTGA